MRLKRISPARMRCGCFTMTVLVARRHLGRDEHGQHRQDGGIDSGDDGRRFECTPTFSEW